jgi:hypothetical protein
MGYIMSIIIVVVVVVLIPPQILDVKPPHTPFVTCHAAGTDPHCVPNELGELGRVKHIISTCFWNLYSATSERFLIPQQGSRSTPN